MVAPVQRDPEPVGAHVIKSHTYRRARDTLLQRYSDRLVRLADRSRAEAAIVRAQHEAALAEVARIDMLKAQAKNPEKSEFLAHMFVAHMSHELRTPLNAIIGFSDLLRLSLQNLEVDGKLLGYVDDVNSAGWHLLRVVNDILDLTKIEAGRLELREEEVEVGAVLDACARMVKGQIAEQGLAFESEMAAGLPKLLVDELKLKQIVINLLSNAAKFTPAGGTVALTASLDAGSRLTIVVRDTGIGIAPEDLQKVFTPFTQLNANHSRKVQGTGLGLPLTKALVELHGGRLALESEPGKGTAVTVRFPARRTLGATGSPVAA